MSASENQRQFLCAHCSGKIKIPADLPPTTAPCPHCQKMITSPALDAPDGAPGTVPPPPGSEQAASAPSAATPAPGSSVNAGPDPPPEVPPDPVPASPEHPPSTQPPSTPAAEPESADAEPPEEPATVNPENERPKRRLPIAALIVLLLLILIAAAVFFLMPKLMAPSEQAGPDFSHVDQSGGQRSPAAMERQAREVLAEFLAASSVEDRAESVIPVADVAADMRAFYRNGPPASIHTPAEGFTVFELKEEDLSRGIFMLEYDQPESFEIGRFFTPIAPLEVQYQLESPGMLLATQSRPDNFTGEAVRVLAIFKREDNQAMRLDWHTFVQTKYRLMQEFLDLPRPGESQVFRVIMAETVPESREAPAGTRIYSVMDPAYQSETMTRVEVAADSELGQVLSVLNWRGTEDDQVARTATVELRWSEEENPRLELHRFICWEFLGVGDESGEETATDDRR